MDQEPSDYEKLRQTKIARNKQVLAELGFSERNVPQPNGQKVAKPKEQISLPPSRLLPERAAKKKRESKLETVTEKAKAEKKKFYKVVDEDSIDSFFNPLEESFRWLQESGEDIGELSIKQISFAFSDSDSESSEVEIYRPSTTYSEPEELLDIKPITEFNNYHPPKDPFPIISILGYHSQAGNYFFLVKRTNEKIEWLPTQKCTDYTELIIHFIKSKVIFDLGEIRGNLTEVDTFRSSVYDLIDSLEITDIQSKIREFITSKSTPPTPPKSKDPEQAKPVTDPTPKKKKIPVIKKKTDYSMNENSKICFEEWEPFKSTLKRKKNNAGTATPASQEKSL